jgi:hypothetical protein
VRTSSPLASRQVVFKLRQHGLAVAGACRALAVTEMPGEVRPRHKPYHMRYCKRSWQRSIGRASRGHFCGDAWFCRLLSAVPTLAAGRHSAPASILPLGTSAERRMGSCSPGSALPAAITGGWQQQRTT